MRNLRKIIAAGMCLVLGTVFTVPYTGMVYAAEKGNYYTGILRGAEPSATPYESSTTSETPSESPTTSETPDPVTPEPSPSAAPSASPSASPSITPSASPSAPVNNFVVSDSTHLFFDYTYTKPVSGSSVVIYGNGINKDINGTKVNNKQFIAYTDITASYNYTVNTKGVVKPAAGKVITGITKSNVKPQVNKNKITDTEAAKIAKAKIKNGQVTVTATGKEGGVVYLWVIDTGSKAVYDCYPVNVQLAPKKLEIQDTAGSKLKNPKIATGSSINVRVAGIVSDGKKTTDCTYTATVNDNSKDYVSVKPVDGKTDEFEITAKGLKNNKNTKVNIVFECNENGKKIKFKATIKK